MVLDVADPTIAFIGLVRPIVGSIITISEIQTRWMAKVFSGKIPLPSLQERKEAIKRDNTFWDDYFKNSSQRIEGLVEAFTYGVSSKTCQNRPRLLVALQEESTQMDGSVFFSL